MNANELSNQVTGYFQWKQQLISNIEFYQNWLIENNLNSFDIEQRLEQGKTLLIEDQLTIAMVGEYSRGKTELINALICDSFGQRILPSQAGRTTMCPTEIYYDAQEARNFLRLLPIESRLNHQSIQQLKADKSLWTAVHIDVDKPEAITDALKQLAATKEIDLAAAAELGFDQRMLETSAQTPGKVIVPVWRHALLSLDNPLLKQGIRFLDTPGLNALGSEPELTISMLPKAQAIIFLLSADTGVTASDMAIWEHYIDSRDADHRAGRFAVLNKIDVLWDDLQGETHVADSITEVRKSTAEQLGINLEDVIAISAKQALIDAVAQLQGAPIPASVLETDVLPARLREYSAADLDQLCTAGEVVWVGGGSLGARDGRVRLLFRDTAGLLVPTLDEPPSEPIHTALLEHLRARGASFWSDLVGAAQAAGVDYDDTSVLAALWDLAWAGYVTNDSLAPLRAFLAGKPRRSASGKGRGRPRPGRLSRLGPAAGAGRWSLVAPLLEPAPSPTEAAHAKARQLLERYGVLTREAALGEGSEGGFAGVYPVLKALEERGELRRGYFVSGLGAAQFALPGAVDRLRAARESDDRSGPVVLAATDPAQPYGAALPWPESAGRPARQAGAHVLLVDGELVAYLERGGHSVSTFTATADHPLWPEYLKVLVESRRYRSLEIRKIDSEAAAESDWRPALEAAGYRDGYKGLVHRPPRPASGPTNRH